MSYNMYVPTRTMFGAGQLNNLHEQKMPGKKAMIVISNGKSTRENGYLARTEEQLKLAGVETVVFDKVEANPLRSTIMAGGAFAKENNCDFIVALGSGSCMDAAEVMMDAGYEVSTAIVDISSRESIHALVKKATAIGDVTGVVLAAGVSPSQSSPETILNVDLYGTAVVLGEFGNVIVQG